MSRIAFIYQDINNGALRSINAMPQKDSTSDGTSSFEMGRRVYTETTDKSHPITNPQKLHKKWIGGNHDSSQITENRKNNSIGRGSINTTNKLLSFTTYRDVNTVNDALTRCRAGGAVAPPKKNAKNTNGLTPSFKPAKPLYNNYVGTKYPVLYH